MIDFGSTNWRKSSRSNNQGECVEMADGPGGVVGVRDSKDPAGPVLVVAPASWSSFVAAARAGTFTS
ncbi:DUF397 domain-containing protein [Solwaraspora sp. WMMA2065]|uniref:DUF397 domain-containing protein n=1 Tax=Solwaraspora sp. WMMA2065 TaxID=3015166 RepID=UPI00259BBA7C|nr:DUF397 domain-containing protein [Solwaraspora sp. WMMA2065]WJK32635.1 DUF397 domain-containing protein [Solwaraspora sp. WMMA2065]